jgi:hypothetical protein
METFVSLIWFEGWFIWAEGMVAVVVGIFWGCVCRLLYGVGMLVYLFERERERERWASSE